MSTAANDLVTESGIKARPKKYMVTLIILMGLVALLDQYISMIKTTAIPYAIEEYGITASEFSWYEALYLSATFLIFLLNGLNDIIGRKLSILVLTLLMGLSSLAIVLFTPSFQLFIWQCLPPSQTCGLSPSAKNLLPQKEPNMYPLCM